MRRYIIFLSIMSLFLLCIQSAVAQIDYLKVESSQKDYYPSREIVNTVDMAGAPQGKAAQLPAISVTPLQSSGYTAATLVQSVLVSGCLQASNVVYTGNQAALGVFNANGSGFPINNGIIMATGNVTNAVGPNQYTNRTTEFTNNGDADLNIITGSNSTRDAAVLEFDFVPAGNTVQFKYVFASEEYPEWACSQFNDVFAFLLSGPGISGGQGFSNNAKNIALLPDAITPVTINNIHVNGWNQNVESSHNASTCPDMNSAYYVNNIGGTSIEYDGSTVVLTAQWQVVPCQTYHIKLAIADVADRKWDSGVMIEGSSFTSNPVSMTNYDLNGNITDDLYEGCGYNFVFARNGGNNGVAINITYSFSGTASATDHSFPTGNVTIPAFQNSVTVPYNVIADALAEGAETLVISIGNGCPCNQNTIIKTLTIHDQFKVNTSSTNISCNGANNGTITATVIGGTGNYMYSLNGEPLQSSNVFSNLSAGSYVVSVTNGSACAVNSTTVIISNPIAISASSSISHSILCYGDSDAVLTVTAAGGTGAYSYSLNGGPVQASNTFAGLPAGTYSITVYDANNCSATANAVTINNPALLTASVQGSAQVSCYNVEDGQIIVTAAGGTGAYSYSLNGGPVQASNTFTGLPAGSYSITVYDANNCSATANAVTINNPALLTASTQGSAQVSCYNAGDGQIIVSAAGGTGVYSYSLNGGPVQASNTFTGIPAGTYSITVYDANNCSATANAVTINNPTLLTATAQGSAQVSCYNAEDGQIIVSAAGGTGVYSYSLNGGPVQASNTFTGLPAGSYSIMVFDANNCSATTNAVTINNPALLTASAQGSAQVSCYNVEDGQIIVTAAGGTGAYSYSLNGGPVQASNTFTGLPAGTYTITIYDANNCSATANAVTINNPALLTASAQGSAQVSCFNAEDGQIIVSAAGGTGAYSYSLNGGPVQASNTFIGLPAGTYSITVYDANNCSATVNAVTINNPALLTATAQGSAQVSCYNAEDGQIIVSAAGGTGVYSYSLNGGPVQASNTFTGLPAGSYSIMVFDANNCSATTNAVTINNPALLTASAQGSAQVSCYNVEDGQIIVSAAGGTGAYSYSLNGGPVQASNTFTGLPAGSYSIMVFDANNCSAGIQELIISKPEVLTISVESSPQVSCNNAEDGQIVVSVTGGTGAYSYSINGGESQSSPEFSNLAAGTYIITVYDINQCAVTSGEINIANPAPISIYGVVANPVSCFGSSDGQLIITANGGTGSYSYSLNGLDPQSSNVFSDLYGGNYSITVFDEKGCQAGIESILVSSPTMLTAAVEQPELKCAGSALNPVIVSASGGVAPYSYSVDGGQTFHNSGIFDSVSAGSILVEVRDANGCSSGLFYFTVQQLQAIALNVNIISGNKCGGVADAAISAEVNGGTPPYNYAMDNNALQASSYFEEIAAGTHTLYVYDESGCGAVLGFEITAQIPIKAELVSITDADCSGTKSGAAEISVSGGVEPYTYAWSHGENTPYISNVAAGSYTANITDANGCSFKFPVNISPGVVYDDIEIHNVFSPNGDGINDTWVVDNLAFYPDNELVIVNRWGNEVYSQKSYQNDWDGSNLLEGTYFYILNVTMCGEAKTFNGYITIVH